MISEEFYQRIKEYVAKQEYIGYQRLSLEFKIGYGICGRVLNRLEKEGIIDGPTFSGHKVLVKEIKYEQLELEIE